MAPPLPPIPPGALLRQIPGNPIEAAHHLWGFGGLHGGMTLAVLASVMRRNAPDGAGLRSATIRMHRPLTEPFAVETAVLRSGRVTTLTAQARRHGTVHADASAIFERKPLASCQAVIPISPPAPSAPHVTACEPFAVPPQFAPISASMEIRPVGGNRPYSGGTEPELTAWIRLNEDDEPPDSYRLILLMDALAPSYAAVLTDFQPVPTVDLTVRFGQDVGHATSPWILLRARTIWASANGWLEEHINAWDPAGAHLGAAHQFRILRGSVPS